MKRNKIKVDNYKVLLTNDDPLFLEIDCETKIDIVVQENISTKISIISNYNYDINIKLESGSNLIVNSLNKDNSVNIQICLLERTLINYNHSVLANNNSINVFNINHLDNSSISYLNNNGINNSDSKLFFNINGIIPAKLNDIICDQKSKIINLANGNSKIIPNLIIDSNDVVANHSAYIGEINKDELFYMKSRGINENDIKNMIYKATILGKMDLDFEKENFNKTINEWW